ncbi:endoglucanase-6B [Calycina marina]|uniref:Glucanase n=1 Tax=Calycina marina TaxID=1763456 RepID=A0A9P7YZI9_9HELO|nr:endoglucanase-6B [Calycina marina]
MHLLLTIAAIYTASLAATLQSYPSATDVNPFLGKEYYANSEYAAKLDQTIAAFNAKNDGLNAARARSVKNIGTFVWITSVSSISVITSTVEEARAIQEKTGKPQIVELVLYDLPNRDCSGGHSGGEFDLTNNGLALYKSEFIDPYAKALEAAPDLTFAVILEPDSLGNLITNQEIPYCQAASPGYEEGLAYAIAKLQLPNVALYLDAAHGGWLGWDDNLGPAAAQFAKVVALAKNFTSKDAPVPKIRGFSTDVSNFNPYIANPRATYTEYSNSYDELHYAESLAPYLTNKSLPAHFIIDQGRSGLQNTRTDWGEWCNVAAGFGIRPITQTNSSLVDSIVWAKPGGESDGACGPMAQGKAAPSAGAWFEEYVENLVIYADPPLEPTYL